ncbi:MAG: hypothetical protein HY908_28995 [Myxococcales bacterium]|nr:hypothetical protein [Myxococcales bacterium]
MRNITDEWRDGVTPDTQPFKPEYRDDRSGQTDLPSGSATWYACSHTRGTTLRLRLWLRARLPPGRPNTMHVLRLEPETPDADGEAFTFVAAPNAALVDGTPFALTVAANAPLPRLLRRYQMKLRLSVVLDHCPARVLVARHALDIFVTFGPPGGQMQMHQSLDLDFKQGVMTTQPFPETGALQSVTVRRLARAMEAVDGAASEQKAMSFIFRFLQEEQINYYPYRRYPTPSELQVDPAANPTDLQPLPDLHTFLWIALAERMTCHCSDLAAAFRMMARILGIRGAMDVKFAFPWPPWDGTGQARDYTKKPRQGALKPYPDPGNATCIFFDHNGVPNQYEGVLRWEPPGEAGRAILYAVSDKICGHFLPGDPPDMDDLNASLYFEESLRDGDGNVHPDKPLNGHFKLAMRLNEGPGGLRAPVFSFLGHDTQTLFEFHYQTTTFEPGDDRQAGAGGKI